MLDELAGQATIPEGDGYTCWDHNGVELETAWFLYRLVTLVKPALVVECGTGGAFASRFIAAGLRDNGHGRLVTFEPLENFAELARERLAGLPAEVRPGHAIHDGGDLDPDMVFVDCAPAAEREREIGHWLGRTDRDGRVMLVHDGYRYGQLAGRGTMLRSPRGLWLGANL